MSDAAATVSSRPPLRGYLMLASLGLFWGLNWPGMKIVLEEMTVWWFRSFSVGVGAAGLLLIAWASGQRVRPALGDLPAIFLCAVFSILGWHIFTGYGVSLMPAGRASIIAFTMPVWAALLSTWLLGEPLTRYKIVGLALGVAGLAALIGPDLAVFGTAPLGALFMAGAALSWAIGTVLFKKFETTLPVASAIGWQLLIGAIVITFVAIEVERFPDLGALSWKAVGALLYLFALPMIYCQWAFFSVVKMLPAAIASIGTLAVPVVGVYSSALLLGEPVGASELTALALIFAALLVVLVLPHLGRRR